VKDEANIKNGDRSFVPVISTYNLGDIRVLKSILDGQGFEYYLQDENTAYIRGYMDTTILMVREDQVETVNKLLKDLNLKFTMFSTNK
jgi:hypothetical protein